ncbi:MAG: 30S ribosome-binding factor RbfA [Calditrichota bacterium]
MAKESVRQRKVADRVREAVSIVIDRKIKDPDKGFVTVTKVKMSRDLSIASIYFTVLGDEKALEKSLAALNRAKNFIRHEIAQDLNLRVVPDLRFFEDDTMSYSRKIDELLESIKKDEPEQD